MPDTMTITEALAELKTLAKRLEKKRQGIAPYLFRQEGLKDPIKDEGGSVGFVTRERQAIGDLERRVVNIRTAIQLVNLTTPMTVLVMTQTIQEWLNWRKEVAPIRQQFLAGLMQSVLQARKMAQQKGFNVKPADTEKPEPMDILVNLDEQELMRDIETLETILGTLDGQLSLKNATVMITVA